MATLLPNGKQSFFTSDGKPLVGGKVYTFAAGTNTPKPTYAEFGGINPNANPVILDSRGEALIFWSGTYKITLKDALDNLIWTVDNVYSIDPSIATLPALSGPGGAALIGLGTRTVADRFGDERSIMDFGAIGDGIADDTAAFQSAINSGENLFAPRSKVFAISGTLLWPNNNQTLRMARQKKLGTDIVHMNQLANASSGVTFFRVEIDGSAASFAPGSAVSAIFAKVCRSFNMTQCYIHDFVDDAFKGWNCAGVYAAGNLIDGNLHGENGFEFHNYPNDPNTGLPFVGGNPPLTGTSRIIANRIIRISRFENPAGPLVDATAVNMSCEGNAPLMCDMDVSHNDIEDGLRGIWSENNLASSYLSGFTISNNKFRGSVSGGTGANVYGKNAIGLLGAKNGIVIGNIVSNFINSNPAGTRCAGLTLSGSFYGVGDPRNIASSNIDVANNDFIDTQSGDRMQYGIVSVYADDIRIRPNFIGSASILPIYVEPSTSSATTTNLEIHSNRGSQDEYSWIQPGSPILFSRDNIPASVANSVVKPTGLPNEDDLVAPYSGRLVGFVVKTSVAISAGTLTVRVYANGVAAANLTITNGDFVGTVADMVCSTTSGLAIVRGQRLKVDVTTDAGFLPTTLDLVAEVTIDAGLKQ